MRLGFGARISLVDPGLALELSRGPVPQCISDEALRNRVVRGAWSIGAIQINIVHRE